MKKINAGEIKIILERLKFLVNLENVKSMARFRI